MKKKIIVIGSPGSGKSYFSKELTKILDIPVYHMDIIYWRDDRTHIAREELVGKIDTITSKEKWIIDGNYISTMEQRIKCAETIVYLDYSTEQCLEGIRSRVGIKREDMPWVEESLDKEFIDFVTNFQDDTKPRIIKLLEKYSDKKVILFTTREEADLYLDLLKLDKSKLNI